MLYYIFKLICNPQYVYYLLIYYYTFTFLYNSFIPSLYLINYFIYLPSNYLYYLYYYNIVNNNICNNINKSNNDDNDNDNDNKVTISLNNCDENKFILL